jgi:hypothetical protein
MGFYLVLGLILGLAIAWIDSQPGWDDTGLSVFLILTVSASIGYLTGQKPWLTALAVSIWIPLWAVACTHNYGGFLALVPGFTGAYAGYILKRLGRQT